MRTIGRHWPSSAPLWDVQSICDYCGVVWRKSQLRRDGAHLLAYRYCSTGGDIVTLSQENAQRARDTQDIGYDSTGRMDGATNSYETTPIGILGSSLVGWWGKYGIVVGGSTDDDAFTVGNPDFGTSDYLQYQALQGSNSARSGVSKYRNLAKEYTTAGTPSPSALSQEGYLDLYADGVFAPEYSDGKLACDATGTWSALATRRLMTAKSATIAAEGSNPCVWIVFKPTGNVVSTSVDPTDHCNFGVLFELRRAVQSHRYTGAHTDVFSIMWGDRLSSSGASTQKWQARGRYNAGGVVSYASSSVNDDTARRIWSARMETDSLVLKIADTEFGNAGVSGDDLEYDMLSMAIGEYINGEISEVILTSDVPTAAEISSLESYLKKAHPDISETL